MTSKTTIIDLILHLFIFTSICTHLPRYIYGDQIQGARGEFLTQK